MEEEKTLLNEVASERYDASDRPFDFVGEGGLTALVCETDPAGREKISGGLKELGYQITAPGTTREALKAMRFHVFDVVVLNEVFDTPASEPNAVLNYIANMAMTTRRRLFVALVSEKYRTMDNMVAFNRSVNIVVNLGSINDIGQIIKQGVAENRAFYHIFQETLQKMGKA
jgi:response regulator RpfG family c-di-GMP phosphodiesterase